MRRTEKKNLILDVDTGIDDALAILCCIFSDRANTTLITTCSGNTTLENSTRNTLNILQFEGKESIPVASGSPKPLKKQRFQFSVHGNDGMGDYHFPELKIKAYDDAIDKMYEAIMNFDSKTSIISLGPVTNIALLLLKHPEVKDKLDKVLISGGLIEQLNEGELPYMSYNIGYDPEALQVILDNKIDLWICPSNHGHDAYLNYEDIFKTKYMNKTGSMLEYLFRSYKDRHVASGVATHDLCAVFSLLYPEMFEVKPAYVHINYIDELKTGVIDFDFKSFSPNCIVMTTIDIPKFKKQYFSLLKKMP